MIHSNSGAHPQKQPMLWDNILGILWLGARRQGMRRMQCNSSCAVVNTNILLRGCIIHGYHTTQLWWANWSHLWIDWAFEPGYYLVATWTSHTNSNTLLRIVAYPDFDPMVLRFRSIKACHCVSMRCNKMACSTKICTNPWTEIRLSEFFFSTKGRKWCRVQPGFLATYWVPGAIGHSILRPEDPILTESQSLLGVPRACQATPSRLRLSCWCSQMSFLKTSLSGKQESAQLLPPPPLENDPTPFTKNRLLVPGLSCSTGWGHDLGSAHEKKRN